MKSKIVNSVLYEVQKSICDYVYDFIDARTLDAISNVIAEVVSTEVHSTVDESLYFSLEYATYVCINNLR